MHMPVKATTRAFQLTDFSLDKITSADSPVPELGPHDVLVKMKATSLNFRDLLVAKGLYSRNLKLPLVPLSDGAGEVVEVGSAVTRVKRGDRVTPIFMQKWLGGQVTAEASASALGGAIDGVLRNEGVFDENGLVKIPSHLSFEEAATLPCAALTAWHAMYEAGHVVAGSSLLTLGTGGVSIFALQFAKASGAQVVITSSSDEKLEHAKKLGADVLINYRKNADWDKAVLKEFPDGVDHAIEVGGAGTLDRSIRSIRPGGHISLIGLLAMGGQFDATKLLMKSIRLQGIFVGSREMFERMNKAIEVNKIKPVIDRTFKVEEIAEALRYMESGSHFGKIVLKF
jgi:NADPH:quinone reductase-like Zn-dependent oxidoreductase